MKTLYLEPFSGISGDMLLAALFDLGLDQTAFKTELNKLGLDGYEIQINQDNKSAINGHTFQVKLIAKDQTIDSGLTFAEHSTEQHHHHHTHHHGRNFHEIEAIILASALSDEVKHGAIATFREIANAESAVHGLSIEDVHFHEVGALDSIVDIVGVFIGLELMGIERVLSGELADGTGTINVAHGTMPVPVPAVMMMRQGTDIPIHQRMDVHTELITPTGLALVKTLVEQFGPQPSQAVLTRVGYGFGSRETGSLNALRVSLFDSKKSERVVQKSHDEILELHTNVDDSTGEKLAFVMDKLIDAGVYDAFFTPIFMKKQRPAYELTLILPEQLKEVATEILFKYTTTIGLRWTTMHRTTMERAFKVVETEYGKVHVKLLTHGAIKKSSFEMNDLIKLALAHDVTIDEIEQAARLELLK